VSRRFVLESAGRTGDVVPTGWRPGGNCAWMVDLGSDLGDMAEGRWDLWWWGGGGLEEGVRRVVRGVSKAAMPFLRGDANKFTVIKILSQAKKF